MSLRKEPMKKPYKVIVKNLDGWWSAVCPELAVSGFGRSKTEAIQAVVRSMQSTLTVHAQALREGPKELRHLAEMQVA